MKTLDLDAIRLGQPAGVFSRRAIEQWQRDSANGPSVDDPPLDRNQGHHREWLLRGKRKTRAQ